MVVRINESSGSRSTLRRWVTVVASVAVVISILWAWWGRDELTPSQSGESHVGNDSKPKATAFGGWAASSPQGQPLVEVDLLGTRMDVSRLFQLGFGGGLQMDGETRSTLDTLLMQMSDPPTPQEAEKLEYTLRQGLPKEEAEKALKLFQGYRGYQAEMLAQGTQLGIPETAQSVDDYFAQVARIQRHHFEETRNARAVMLAAVIDQNPNLTAAQKKEQIDALRAELPPDQRGLVPEPSPGAASEAK
jgi:hypothetical protein